MNNQEKTEEAEKIAKHAAEIASRITDTYSPKAQNEMLIRIRKSIVRERQLFIDSRTVEVDTTKLSLDELFKAEELERQQNSESK